MTKIKVFSCLVCLAIILSGLTASVSASEDLTISGTYEDNCFIVYFQGENNSEEENYISILTGAEISEKSAQPIKDFSGQVTNYNQYVTFTFAPTENMSVSKAINTVTDKLASSENFISAFPNYLGELDSIYSADDPYYSGDNDYEFADTSLQPSKINKVWDISTGSSSVIVGVLDTGASVAYEDLDDNIWANTGEIAGNGIDDDGNGYIDDVNGWNFVDDNNDLTDNKDHGNAVASLIGAEGNNGIGMTGACWNVQIMVLKVYDDDLGKVLLSSVIDAINYASSFNVPILNMSFSFTNLTNSNISAFQNAVSNYSGLVVASSGNSGINVDASASSKVYPACLTNDNIITVGGTEADGTKATPHSGEVRQGVVK